MTWFFTTRLGRLTLALLTVMGVAGVVYRKGQTDQKATETRRRVEAMREAMEVRDDVQNKSDADIHVDLSEWVRDHNK